MVVLYSEWLDNRLLLLQILVPLHEITTLGESFVSVNSLFYSGISNLAVTSAWYFFHFSASLRKQDFFSFFRIDHILCDPSAFFHKFDRSITCFCLYHQDTFRVTADTRVSVWWVWLCAWACIPGYANGVGLA